MEDKKSKKILLVVGPFESSLSSFYELIKNLISLGHNVTCYVEEEFETKFKPTGARLKTYKIDKSGPSKLPPAIAKRAVVPLGVAKSYIPILDDFSKSPEQYDYLMVDSFYDGNEMNKVLKIPTVIVLYTIALGEKTPFVEMSMIHRKHYWIPVNKKYKINVKDFLLQHFSPDAKYKLILSSKLFHPELKKVDDSYFFIGPSFYERPKDTTFDFKKDEGKKLIYISFGSTFNANIECYKMCMEAFGNSKEYQVLMSVGKNIDIKELGDIPENFSVYNRVPQQQVLSMADVFINHGGNNSVYEAIFLAHLPIIIIPMIFAHEENAKLIEKLGAGISLDKEELSPEILSKTVETYLADKEKYLKGVDKIAESFKEARDERKKVFEKILC